MHHDYFKGYLFANVVWMKIFFLITRKERNSQLKKSSVMTGKVNDF